MADAYEIGISLVLQDGVSAGLGMIRRDLAVLDRAIAVTSRKLSELRGSQTEAPLNSTTSTPVSESLPRETPRPLFADEGATRPATDIAVPGSVPAPRRESGVAPSREPAPRVPTASPEMTSLTPQATSPSFIRYDDPASGPNLERHDNQADTTVAGPRLFPPPSAPPGLASVSPVAPANSLNQASTSPDLRVGAVAAPSFIVAEDPRGNEVRPRKPASGPLATSFPPPIDPQPVAMAQRRPVREDQENSVSPPSHLTRKRSLSNAAPKRASLVVPSTDITGNRQNESASPGQASADRLITAPIIRTMTAPQQDRDTSGGTQARTAVAPTSTSTNTITLQGDIILDGARVGRWLASTLARQAARPTASPTGPDPRQTPLWSGQAQGF